MFNQDGPRANPRSKRICERLESSGAKPSDFLERVEQTLRDKEERREQVYSSPRIMGIGLLLVVKLTDLYQEFRMLT